MSKKVTIRDVAKLAGVSVATVSYVLNQKKGQKISEATRRKVLQISNLLGYMHSSLVKSLISQKSNNVSLFYSPSSNMLRKSLDMRFFEELADSLHGIGKELMVQPRLPNASVTFSDAIVAYNVTPTTFHAIGNSNFIPLIGVNVLINDPLFFQINTSMARAQMMAKENFGRGPFDVLYISNEDSALDNKVLQAFPAAICVDDASALERYMTSDRRLPVLCFGQDLYDAANDTGRKAVLFDPFPKDLIDKVTDAVVKTTTRSDAGNKSFEF